jgi:hypothetical protein
VIRVVSVFVELDHRFFTSVYSDPVKRRAAAGVGCRCSTCEVWWSGASTCHCPTCHQTFTTSWSFDLHRVGGESGRRCLDPATCRDRDRALVLVERGGVYAWSRPMDDRERARLARLRRSNDL